MAPNERMLALRVRRLTSAAVGLAAVAVLP